MFMDFPNRNIPLTDELKAATVQPWHFCPWSAVKTWEKSTDPSDVGLFLVLAHVHSSMPPLPLSSLPANDLLIRGSKTDSNRKKSLSQQIWTGPPPDFGVLSREISDEIPRDVACAGSACQLSLRRSPHSNDRMSAEQFCRAVQIQWETDRDGTL